MPSLRLLHEMGWPLAGNVRLGWFAKNRDAFVIGNHADKLLLSPASVEVRKLSAHTDPYAAKTIAFDTQLNDEDVDALRAWGVEGFRFLSRQQYATMFTNKSWGSVCPVDQALAAGLRHGFPMAHPVSGSVVAMTDRAITLVGGESLKAKAPITAVLASSQHAIIFFGTNAGDLYAVVIEDQKLSKAKKLASFGRVVTSIQPSSSKKGLFVGGMGFVARLVDDNVLNRLDTSCRSLHPLSDSVLLVNQGLHGIRFLHVSENGITAGDGVMPSAAVDRLIVSDEGRFVLALYTPPAGLGLFAIE